MTDDIMPFEFPTDTPSIIKVIGVGGGGGNAVNHMYKEGIHDVTFVLCNTDNQALAESPVPVKLQLGRSITEGLGAGNKPERASAAAEESIEDIKTLLSDGTKMVFITAGMGGGTGTGAAPVIAKTAKEMDILTVGIVTIPFLFEGEKKIIQALDGVEQISRHVDALLVINNERLREIYSDLTFMNAFGKADDTLSIAAKSIAEIITMRGKVNLDFADVNTILKNGGVAIMSTGLGEGENRVSKAIEDALHSPLLNNNDIFNAKKVLLNVSFCEQSELMMEEMNEVHEFMSKFDKGVEVIWGVAVDDALGNKVKITVLATGFGMTSIPGMDEVISKRTQEEEERLAQLEEKEEENRRRIVIAYGEEALKGGAKAHKRRRHVYIFNPEDLDNDEIIASVENSPTYQRDKATLEKIKTKATAVETVATPETEDGSNIISFN
ncbi:cell division protein FtsZ [Bacteroides luti]|uniref:Cell division protein FtsZ n=1 Tax=Bacteroides luti TaxID=1297750 RepID=A0A1M5A259_9BACE|nr:cell division protein FtsZ [Bacteroides luti]SHF24389.1 cell division protein FtsZ [Bacteroides luti]